MRHLICICATHEFCLTVKFLFYSVAKKQVVLPSIDPYEMVLPQAISIPIHWSIWNGFTTWLLIILSFVCLILQRINFYWSKIYNYATWETKINFKYFRSSINGTIARVPHIWYTRSISQYRQESRSEAFPCGWPHFHFGTSLSIWTSLCV